MAARINHDHDYSCRRLYNYRSSAGAGALKSELFKVVPTAWALYYLIWTPAFECNNFGPLPSILECEFLVGLMFHLLTLRIRWGLSFGLFCIEFARVQFGIVSGFTFGCVLGIIGRMEDYVWNYLCKVF